MAAKKIELTILMPCLNEAETLAACIADANKFLARSKVSGEVVIADNGSTDGSQDIATKAGARVVDVPEKGYGAALAGGIAAARGEFIIMGDADQSYDFVNLEGFVAQLRDGADLVMGNRFAGGVKPGAMPWLHKYIGNPVLSFAGRLFFGSKSGDFHCGLRGVRRDAIRNLNLRTTGMEFASEMVVKATLFGLKVVEVPTTLSPDGRSRAPHLRSFRDGWRHLRFLLLFSPRWLFLYPGMALLAFGLILAALLARGPLQITPNIELDVQSLLVASMSIILGLQAISFALIGRRFATRYGFIPPSDGWAGMLEALTLERVLLLAVFIVALGGTGMAFAVWQWASLDFGPLDYSAFMRLTIGAVTALVAGAQMIMTAFLASVIDIPLYERRITDVSEFAPTSGEPHPGD